MKLNVVAKFGVHEQHLIVSCGDGKRTFKWLGLTVGQRLAALRPNGRLRAREEPRLVNSHGMIQPKRVYSEHCTFFHPGALLSDYLQDQGSITIEFSTTIPVDEYGNPVWEDWQKLAFLKSETSSESADQVMYKLSQQISESEMAEHKSNAQARALEVKRASHFMTQLLRSQLIDEDKILREVEGDWVYLSQAHHIEKGATETRELQALEDIVINYFLYFNDLFQRFCDHPHAVSFDKVKEMVESSGIFVSQIMPSEEQLRVIFNTTAGKLQLNVDDPLPRAGFISYLIRMASFRFIGTFDVTALERIRKAEDVHRTSIPSNSQALKMLVEMVLIPYLERERAECVVKSIILADETLALIRGYHEAMSTVFLKYCQRRGDAFSTLRTQDLVVLCVDAGIAPEVQERGRPRHHHPDSEQGIELANWASNMIASVRGPFIVGKLIQGDYLQDQEVTDAIAYSEFVEMVMRVGLLQLRQAQGTDLEKVNMATQKVAALQNK